MSNHPRKNKIFVFGALMLSYVFTLKYRLFYSGRVSFGNNFITNWRFKITGPGKVTFGDSIHAWANHEPNTFHTFSTDSKITIGDNTVLNGAGLHAQNEISIGSGCTLGSTVITDTDFHSSSHDRSTNLDAPISSKPISIGDNVWIGGRTGILKGVIIGENAIIGFGSVVRENVPEGSTVIGNPAQVVKTENNET